MIDKQKDAQIYFTCQSMSIIYRNSINEWLDKYEAETKRENGDPELLLYAWTKEIDQKIDELMLKTSYLLE